MPGTPSVLDDFASEPGTLEDVRVDLIRTNPENPRLFFRPNELEELQESIAMYGVQVPVTLFKRGHHYVLLDGERRWRCASKLNHKTIPALVKRDPGQLGNLLLMFNIHALREQWDTLTIALKLPEISSLLEAKLGHVPTEGELSKYTGQPRGKIRKCKFLVGLPPKYKELLLKELQRPKGKEAIGEEFFIEMEKSLKSVVRLVPEIDIETARDALVAKYRAGVIESNIEFRKLGKIARAANTLGADKKVAQKALRRVLTDKSYSVTNAWQDTVSEAYAERDVSVRIRYLMSKLDQVSPASLDDEVRKQLVQLVKRIQRLLGEARG